jgi:capsular exopolysaccharide synthesis family protein
MSANLTPALSGPPTALAHHAPPGGDAALVPHRPTPEHESAPPLEAQVRRVVAALDRYKWLIALATVAGVGGGILASRFVEPDYQVQSTIFIPSVAGTPGATNNRGPIEQDQVFTPQGWIGLLRTYSIADSVVLKLALYVEPEKAADSTLFGSFQLNRKAERFFPGEYELAVTGPRWTLSDKIGAVREEGIVGDSIGRRAGFAWAPPKALLGERTINFRVRQPREVSNEILTKRLQVGLAEGANLIVLKLTGTLQQKPAETLNAWGEQFVRIGTDLKAAKVTASSKVLLEQRADAAQRLASAERAYEQYRVSTITQPSEAMAVAPGAAVGGVPVVRSDPAVENYTTSKYQLEALRRDRSQLDAVARTLRPDYIPTEAILNVPVVSVDPAATNLRSSLNEMVALEAQVRVLRETYQDITPPLSTKLAQLRTLQAQTIPQQLRAFLAQLRQRESQLAGVVSQSTSELRAIPQRATQGEALRRDRDAAAELFRVLDTRYKEAELSEKSVTSDVRILDAAVLPSEPTENTVPRLIALGLAVGLGLGVGLAVLLDRVDRRFRYPTQVTHGLGLQILGAVPRVDQSRQQSPERVAQIVEAFRAIRMNVRYACMPNPRVALTITSASPNDGKSLVASNLALSFAEGGWRTVLVDGDLRRGQLNATFDLPSGPGLVEYLEGTSLLDEVVQPTPHDNLSLVATGTRHRRGPELLATPRMRQLITALATEFDAVIVDSPPLSAGTDAYAIGTATTNVAVVVRRAATDVRLAEAKLGVFDQLPTQVIGAVLNEVDAGAGLYQYLAYDPDYLLVEDGTSHEGDREADADVQRLPAGK